MESEGDEVVILRLGKKEWKIGRKRLCSKSNYFRTALAAPSKECILRVFEISADLRFTVSQVNWVMSMFETGNCPPLDEVDFNECIMLYDAGVYFSSTEVTAAVMRRVLQLLDGLSWEIQHKPAENRAGMDLVADLLRRVFGPGAMVEEAISTALLDFVHQNRFYLLQDDSFHTMLNEYPSLAAAMFRRMREGEDFRVSRLPLVCSGCRRKPGARSVFSFAELYLPYAITPSGRCALCSEKKRASEEAMARSAGSDAEPAHNKDGG